MHLTYIVSGYSRSRNPSGWRLFRRGQDGSAPRRPRNLLQSSTRLRCPRPRLPVYSLPGGARRSSRRPSDHAIATVLKPDHHPVNRRLAGFPRAILANSPPLPPAAYHSPLSEQHDPGRALIPGKVVLPRPAAMAARPLQADIGCPCRRMSLRCPSHVRQGLLAVPRADSGTPRRVRPHLPADQPVVSRQATPSPSLPQPQAASALLRPSLSPPPSVPPESLGGLAPRGRPAAPTHPSPAGPPCS